MTAITFNSFQVHDDRPQYTQLDGLQRILAFVGNHNLQYEWLVQETGGSLSNFDTANAQGTWVSSSDTIQGTAGASAQWYKITHTSEIELGFLSTFEWSGSACAFIACSTEAFAGIMAWWDGTSVGIGYVDEINQTDMSKRPFAVTSPATVTVGIWPRSYYSLEDIDDIIVAIWFDGQLALAYALPYSDEWSHRTGFGVYQSGTVNIDNYEIVELHHVQEWTTIDPGEAAGAGLSRVIGQDDILVRARYDGTIKLWVEDSSTTDWTVPSNRIVQRNVTEGLFWPTHLRMAGALYEDSALFREGEQGHIFEVVQDPNALTADVTRARGQRRHVRLEEGAVTTTITMPPNLALEPEDILNVENTKYRIRAISLAIQMQANAQGQGVPILAGQYECQQCLDRTTKTGEAE